MRSAVRGECILAKHILIYRCSGTVVVVVVVVVVLGSIASEARGGAATVC